jgi:Homeodomain-like domain
MPTNTLSLLALRLDEELQPRAAIDDAVLENYVQLLVDGVRFPPVVAFRDAEAKALWLADGFHRWHAHKVLDADGIDVEIIDGSRRDALLYSLSANARHGLQRGAADYQRAYETACRNSLVDPLDVEAVAALLRCSGRTAERLTAKAREAVRARRDADVIRLRGEGKTVRQIAEEVGVPRSTVQDVRNAPLAETGQDGGRPLLSEAAKDNLRELASPPAQNWSAALRALRGINEQVSVDALFAERFAGFDHAFGPALDAAHEWINELHGRFVNERERDRRRRA